MGPPPPPRGGQRCPHRGLGVRPAHEQEQPPLARRRELRGPGPPLSEAPTSPRGLQPSGASAGRPVPGGLPPLPSARTSCWDCVAPSPAWISSGTQTCAAGQRGAHTSGNWRGLPSRTARPPRLMDKGPRAQSWMEGLVRDRAAGERQSWGQTLGCGHPLGGPHSCRSRAAWGEGSAYAPGDPDRNVTLPCPW